MPDIDPATVTFALLLSGPGIPIAAVIVTALTQLLKAVLPVAGHERQVAFVVSAVLIVVAYVGVTIAAQPPVAVSLAGAFGAFLAWLGVGRLAMAFYDDATGKVNSLTGPAE